MAAPRVFISSTCIDLKHIRSELEKFLSDHLGYDAVRSDKSGVPYKSVQLLEESCYDEIKNCDIFVLIIGGRFGSEAKSDLGEEEDFSKSITMTEYSTAINQDIPAFIFIEADVFAEYDTYKNNLENNAFKKKKVNLDEDFNWAKVNDPRIYKFIQKIESQTRNNPIHSFKEVDDIISHLKSQFAGLFREFLSSQKERGPIGKLDQKISELTNMFKLILDTQDTANTNTAEIVEGISQKLIERESEKVFNSSEMIQHLARVHDLDIEKMRSSYNESNNYEDFQESINAMLQAKDETCGRMRWKDPELKYHLNSKASIEVA